MTYETPVSHTDKDAIRKASRQARKERDLAERQREDADRAQHLVQRLLQAQPTVVAAYLATGDEPDLSGIIEPLTAAGVRLLMPVLGRREDGTPRRDPDWAVWEGQEQTREGIWGISEPTTTPLGARGLVAADVVLCSALAASHEGYRVGVGGGWYDRALAHKRDDAPVIACLNASEVRDDLVPDEWDRRVDFLATGEGIITCGLDVPPSS